MNGLMKLRNPWMIGIEARKKSPEANQWAGKFSLNEWNANAMKQMRKLNVNKLINQSNPSSQQFQFNKWIQAIEDIQLNEWI